MHEAPSTSPTLHKLGLAVDAYHPGTEAVEAGASGVHGHPWVLREFEVSVGFRRKKREE